jgi:hypothetical protein
MPTHIIDETALEKAERLLSTIEASEGNTIAKGGDDPVARVNAMLDEIERMGDPDHVAKRAREDALAKWKAEPLPPKTLGAGAALAMSKERIEKMAKANGYGMSESEWKRGIVE